MLKNVLFDLDGTLTNSKEGIIKCTQYALKRLGQPRNTSELIDSTNLIGLPIHLVFQKLLNSDGKILIEKAISFYRERFSRIGFLENTVYPGIPQLLSFLYEKSYKLYVVTVKPKVYADRIVTYFSLSKWLNGIYGPNLDEYLENKINLIKTLMADYKFVPTETIVVGDREDDIIAGKSNRIKTIGITYGYGSEKEILDSAPDHICHKPSAIQMVITNH